MDKVLNQGTFDNLRDYAESLQRKIEDRGKHLLAEQELLKADQERLMATLKILESDNRQRDKDKAEEPDEDYAGDYAGLGVRDAIRQALENNPHGLRPAQMREVMLEGGFKYTGKAAFATRIGNDLWKMKQTGEIERREKEYFLNTEGAE